ncbi:hypothetical protein [Bacillus sp. CGMCC 1.16541]|uniref:hypothetical protein n=1 Tax=Bacillus sp. CGMCC 1.16541 TaxID=2185143 RepID=UPI000D728236|nr:hypothetical protein [Bacillus sp. CGMCC 1.16541]
MTTFIFISVSSIVLFVTLYFLPLPYDKNGKIVIFGSAVLLAVMGLLANAVLPLHTMLLIVFLLIICCSYLLSKRLSLVGVKEEQIQAYQSFDDTFEESITVEEAAIVSPSTGTLTLEKQLMNNESEQVDDEHIVQVMTKEEVEELFDHRPLETGANQQDEQSSNYEYEIPMLIEEEQGLGVSSDDKKSVLNLDEVIEKEEVHSIDSSLLMDIIVEDVHEDHQENILQTNMIDSSEYLEDVQVSMIEEELIENEEEIMLHVHELEAIEVSENEVTLNERKVEEFISSDQESSILQVDDLTIEAVSQQIDHKDVEEMSIETSDAFLVNALNRNENEFEEAEDVLQEDLPEISMSNGEELLEQLENDRYNGKSEQELIRLEEALVEDEVTEQAENVRDSEATAETPVMNPAVWQTIIEQVNVYKQLSSTHEYESLLNDYLLAPLPCEEYYVLASMLVQHYMDTNQRDEALNKIQELQGKYSDYPVLIAELQYLQEVANNN